MDIGVDEANPELTNLRLWIKNQKSIYGQWMQGHDVGMTKEKVDVSSYYIAPHIFYLRSHNQSAPIYSQALAPLFVRARASPLAKMLKQKLGMEFPPFGACCKSKCQVRYMR